MKYLYDYLTLISIMLYIFVLFGMFQFAPAYLIFITSFMKIYISFMLLYKFNPFRNTITITNIEKKNDIFVWCIFTLNYYNWRIFN